VDGWGRDRFVSTNLLSDDEYGLCVNDVIIFKVDLIVHGNLEPVAASSPTSNCHSCNNSSKKTNSSNSSDGICSNVEESLLSLFNDPFSADVKLIFANSSDEKNSLSPPMILYCHKCVLATRSVVFRKMFFHSEMKESQTGEVYITDIDYQIMYVMIYFLYTDQLPENNFMNEFGMALIQACDKYQVMGLLKYGERYFIPFIDEHSVVSLLRFGTDMNCYTLKQQCLGYMAKHSITPESSMDSNDPCNLDDDLLQEIHFVVETFKKNKKGIRGKETASKALNKYGANCVIM
jgi:hypothetical protein